MDAWDSIINSFVEELFVESVLHFRNVCAIYPDFLKYFEGTILDLVKAQIVVHGPIRFNTLAILQLIELNLHMLDLRIDEETLNIFFVEIGTLLSKCSKTNTMI